VSRVRAAVVIAGEFIAFAPIVEAGSIDFARPKSSYFHRAVKSHLDVRGLQIPMDDPMPVRHFERVRELLRDQERLCVASIEVSEQWRTQGGKKVKHNPNDRRRARDDGRGTRRAGQCQSVAISSSVLY
jgi:hypothetical protein